MKYWLVGLLLFLSEDILGQDRGDRFSNRSKHNKYQQIQDFVPGVLIIKFKKISSGEKIGINSPEIQDIKLSTGSIIQAKQVYENHKESGEDTFGLKRIVEIKFTATQSMEKVIEEIQQNANVEYVERRFFYRKQNASSQHFYIYKKDPPSMYYPYINYINYLPNDPYLYQQDYLNKVEAYKAWEVSIGPTKPVIIAILDSGLQFDHEDLAANVFYNSAEIPNNGIDDEADGYIDNYYGWDYVGISSLDPVEDNDPSVHVKNNYHGIHVSGLASAVSNNSTGIASIANNRAKLLIIKVGSDNDPNNVKNGYEAIVYAVDHGAKIINCSWGGKNAGLYGQNIINYAISRDCLIIAAAGNEGKNAVDYPAAYPGVLAVANVSNSDIKSSMSNYGQEIGISAPGENIYSTIYDTYGFSSGTSMATPLVSSAAALVMAKFPNLSTREIAERLKATADPIDGLNPNFSGKLGSGRLNVWKALTVQLPTSGLDKNKVETVQLMQNFPNPGNISTSIKFAIPSDGPTFLTLYSLSGQTIKELLNAYLYEGGYKVDVGLNDIANGIYIYTLYHKNIIRSLKMHVSK